MVALCPDQAAACLLPLAEGCTKVLEAVVGTSSLDMTTQRYCSSLGAFTVLESVVGGLQPVAVTTLREDLRNSLVTNSLGVLQTVFRREHT